MVTVLGPSFLDITPAIICTNFQAPTLKQFRGQSHQTLLTLEGFPPHSKLTHGERTIEPEFFSPGTVIFTLLRG